MFRSLDDYSLDRSEVPHSTQTNCPFVVCAPGALQVTHFTVAARTAFGNRLLICITPNVSAVSSIVSRVAGLP